MKIEELDLEKAKDIIIAWVKNKPFITKVYLFGSRVTGLSKKSSKPVRPDSDLDVAIEFKQISEKEDTFTTWIADSKGWHKELLDLLGFSKAEHLDLEWHHQEQTPHITQYLNEGSILIYPSPQ